VSFSFAYKYKTNPNAKHQEKQFKIDETVKAFFACNAKAGQQVKTVVTQ
jgi:hypothetical protein